MMIKNIKTILAIIAIFIVVSCNKDRLVYKGEADGKAGLYFYSVATTDISGNPLSYRDSITYDFQNDLLTTKERIVNVPVKVIGDISDKERFFKVKIIGGTAKEGQDFEPLKESYVVAAKAANAFIPVKVYRTSKLTKESYYLEMRLEESADFKLMLPELINIGNKTKMDATKFKVRFSEITTMPSYWESFGEPYFGNWTLKKYKLLNDLMEWKPSDWRNAGFSGFPVQSGKFTYGANLMKAFLQAASDRKDPVYEEDGITLMQLGPSFAVDYSKL